MAIHPNQGERGRATDWAAQIPERSSHPGGWHYPGSQEQQCGSVVVWICLDLAPVPPGL